jgi:hypothetical protein
VALLVPLPLDPLVGNAATSACSRALFEIPSEEPWNAPKNSAVLPEEFPRTSRPNGLRTTAQTRAEESTDRLKAVVLTM